MRSPPSGIRSRRVSPARPDCQNDRWVRSALWLGSSASGLKHRFLTRGAKPHKSFVYDRISVFIATWTSRHFRVEALVWAGEARQFNNERRRASPALPDCQNGRRVPLERTDCGFQIPDRNCAIENRAGKRVGRWSHYVVRVERRRAPSVGLVGLAGARPALQDQIA